MSENDKDLTADDIRRLLAKLDAELARRGHSVTVYVVGGANMALAVDNTRTTKDIDAVVKRGHDQLMEAARAVAESEPGLGDDWINSEFTGGDNPEGGFYWRWFDNRDDDAPASFYQGKALAVDGASNEMMLALKTLGTRQQDVTDAFELMRRTGIKTPTEIGRNLFRFTGRRIFEAQGHDHLLAPRIDPKFPHIFDNAPEDLRLPPEPSAAEQRRQRRADRKAAKRDKVSAPRCGAIKVTKRNGMVIKRSKPCDRELNHPGDHRFRGR